MQLVVLSAVRNAVSAATTTFTASSIILFFVIIYGLIVLASVVVTTASTVVATRIGAASGSTATRSSTAFTLGLHIRVVGLLEHHVLHQRLGDHVLLHDLALLVRGLSDDHPLTLRLEQHTARIHKVSDTL